MTTVDPAVKSATSPKAPTGKREVLTAYLALTKPRVVELLLVTTVPVMFLAQRGVPSFWLVLATLIGGSLSAGAANVFNMIYDRDIDAIMHRTNTRPLVTGALEVRQARTFAIVLTVLSTLWLGLLVNWLASALSLSALLFYVLVYTMLLKRRTPQNIVWGGAAGCMPVLVGWAAVTNWVDWPAVLLFLVVFFWTPPHYWPLSMKFSDDYRRAAVPMAPVVQSPVTVARSIVVYTWLMVATSWTLVPVANMGWLYLLAASAAGIWFLVMAHQMLARTKRGASEREVQPMRLFHYSITYVTVLFAAVGVDPLLHLAIR